MDGDSSMYVLAVETPRFTDSDSAAPTQSILIKAPRKKSFNPRPSVATTPTSAASESQAVVFSIGLKPSPCNSLYPSLSVEKQQRVPLRQSRTPTSARRRLFTSTSGINTCFTSPDEGVCCSYSSDSEEEEEAQTFADLYAKILAGQSPSFRPLFLVDARHDHHQLPKPKAIRPVRPKSLFRSKPNTSKVCASCGTRKTPLWRDSDDGIPYCNACGIRYKKYRTRCSSCKYVPRKDERTTNMCVTCGGSLITC